MARRIRKEVEPVNFEDFHAQTAATAEYPWALCRRSESLAYTALGFVGEAGEVANQVKKVLRDDSGTLTPARRDKIEGELGDVFWYLSRFMDEAGIDPEEVFSRNSDKLLGRQADGTIRGDGEHREPVV
jgi:NTP pyrophosphatase (non-canonical NTP hydrolase)